MSEDDNFLSRRIERDNVSPQSLDEYLGDQKDLKDISCLIRCNTYTARNLCIFDLYRKFNTESYYSIGGCYTDNEPDLWFYYTVTRFPRQVYLLNLFVCHRRTGSFTIEISNSNDMTDSSITNMKTLKDSMCKYRFNSLHKDQNHYVKTFNFKINAVESLKKMALLIPIVINMNPPFSLSSDLLQVIKLEHNKKAPELLNDETDFVLLSSSGKKFPVHKTIVMAHSSVLTELMKGSNSSLQTDLCDSDVKFIIQYMYNGDIKGTSMQNINQLLYIAHKFQFIPLSDLIKYSIERQIDVMNAVDVAVIAKKYNLLSLRTKVFNFIKDNPKVFSTEAWKNLNDIELTKSLVEHNQDRKSVQ